MQKQYRRRLLNFFLLAAIASILSLPPVWQFSQYHIQPLLSAVYGAVNNFSGDLASLLNIRQWQRENQFWRETVLVLHSQLASYQALIKENEQLRLLNAMPLSSQYKKIGLQIVGQQTDETGTYYLVNRGQRDGLQVGMPIVVGVTQTDNSMAATLLGTIRSVSQNLSTFNLTTSNISRVVVQIQNDSSTQTLAVGEYNLAIGLKYIPPDDKVEVGQMVVTSHLNPQIPAGLLIGKVTAVMLSGGDFFKTAVVTPLTESNNFNYVYVLLADTD